MMLTLASASKTRAKMLHDVGLDIDAIPSGIDEDEIKEQFRKAGRSAEDLAEALATEKAFAVNRTGLVLGADQVLSFEGETFDKARDLDELRTQLTHLRGNRHSLLSAAVIVEDGSIIWGKVGCVSLTMRDFSDKFLDQYLQVEGETLLDTVGGYRIEGRGAQLFSEISGDYFSILGLPLLDVLEFLREKKVLIR